MDPPDLQPTLLVLDGRTGFGVVFIYLDRVCFSTRFTFLVMSAYTYIKMCLYSLYTQQLI